MFYVSTRQNQHIRGPNPGGTGAASIARYRGFAARCGRWLDVILWNTVGVGMSRHDDNGQRRPRTALTMTQVSTMWSPSSTKPRWTRPSSRNIVWHVCGAESGAGSRIGARDDSGLTVLSAPRHRRAFADATRGCGGLGETPRPGHGSQGAHS